ncbi:MAG: glycosyltransferase family 4 protein [Pseudomonadales bacterium]
MKILWLSHFVPYPPKGGMLSRSYNLLREVSKYHEIHLVSFVQEKPLLTMFSSVEHGKNEAKKHLSQFCANIEFLPIECEKVAFGNYMLAFYSLFSTLPYTVNWLKSKKMKFLLKKLNIEHEFDLVHFDTISLAPYAQELNCSKKILNHHNIESQMMLRRVDNESSWVKKLYFHIEGKKLRKYEKKICEKFSKNITCSPLDSLRLLDVNSSVSVVDVSNGVDMDYFIPDLSSEECNRLIFIGGLNWYPNRAAVDFFVTEVWPSIKEMRPDVVMDIVGQDPPQELLSQAKSDGGLRVHGFVDDIRGYMNRAAVYVCPIDDGGGTKLKVLDALAMGKALVANPVSCEGIDVVHGESVFFASTPEEYVKYINMLLDSKDLRKKFGAKGVQLIREKYSYRALGKKLSSCYLAAHAAPEHDFHG